MQSLHMGILGKQRLRLYLQDHNESRRRVPGVIVVDRLVVRVAGSSGQGNLLVIVQTDAARPLRSLKLCADTVNTFRYASVAPGVRPSVFILVIAVPGGG